MSTPDVLPALDVSKPQEVSYAIPIWLRDLQIEQNIKNVPGRIVPGELQTEPMAVVCYGPSLNETWEQIRGFRHVLTCSGAHKFLIDRGIVPDWHIDVDPRIHKLQLIGEPHKDVQYLLASTCHPGYVLRLHQGGYQVKLWHVFDGQEEAIRVLPAGEWALTGGCSVGLRAIAIARFLGFRSLDIFGMDGCDGKTGKHAAAHPNQSKQSFPTVFNGQTYYTTPSFLEAARQTPHEMDQLPDVTARFHGDGLVQDIMQGYARKAEAPDTSNIAFHKEPLITDDYRRQNAQLHQDNLAYGVGAGKHAPVVKKLLTALKGEGGLPPSVLDYGCGKSFLQKALPFPIFEYDPSIPGKEASPPAADLVCCLDVLEHIEPEKLIFVLQDLRRCVKQVGYFVINTQAAQKTLPDGRNTHLIQQGQAWWEKRLAQFFIVRKMQVVGPEIHVFVLPLKKPKKTSIGTPLTLSRPTVALNLETIQWRTTPYLIGCAAPVLDAGIYDELVASFPPLEIFKDVGGSSSKKYSLSPVNNRDQYEKFLRETPVWMAFYKWVKSPEFFQAVRHVIGATDVKARLGKKPTTRFEFSLLPADGGYLAPHTDIPSKVVTLVVSMLPVKHDWQEAWGGGTDVLEPKAGQPPLEDYQAPLSAFDVRHTFPYQPNQCVVFVKTANSWHSVGPIQGAGSSALRRTLTINIEKGL